MSMPITAASLPCCLEAGLFFDAMGVFPVSFLDRAGLLGGRFCHVGRASPAVRVSALTCTGVAPAPAAEPLFAHHLAAGPLLRPSAAMRGEADPSRSAFQ